MESYRVEDLTFYYPGRAKPALEKIGLTVERGEFIVFCGPSGCGKTTLLRHLKPALAPHGARTGGVFFEGAALETLSHREGSGRIGFVTQSAENQIVTDKVWHELAFGLESLGLATPEIRLRVAEMASFFGIQTWFYKNVTELSGGQKQILNLAAVMVTRPAALLLDEPTSQLDPIAAAEFLAAVGKINRELGVTVLLTEHRLEEVFSLADRVVVLEGGRILAAGTPAGIGSALRQAGHGMFLAMPAATRIWAGAGDPSPCPVSAREGKRWLEDLAARRGLTAAGEGKSGGGSGDGAASGAGARAAAVPAIELREVWFKYEKDLPDVVKGLSCKVFPGELLAILGGNGTGKTTALSLMARLNRPYRGKVLIDGRPIESRPDLFDGCLGVLPQDPQLVFVKKTVREDLLEILDYKKLSREEKMARLAAEAALCGLEDLLDAHPYDLSGGEQQRAALAKILLTRPRILLLDEPTKGLDAEFKQVFAGILKRLAAAGAAIVLVSHDVEFCAEHADRCGLFFDGDIVSEGRPADFFPGNNFYTTAANRIARSVFPRAVTVGDVLDALGGAEPGQSEAELERSGAEPEQSGAVLEQSGAVPERRGAEPEQSGAEPEQSGAEPERRGAEPERRGAEPELPPGLVTAATPAPGRGGAQPPSPEPAPSPPPGLAPWRKALAGGAAAALALTVIFAAPRVEGLKAFISGGDIAIAAAGDLKNVWTYAGIMLALALEAIGLTLALTWKRAGPPPGPPLAMAQATPTAGLAKRRLPKRTLAAAVMILLAIPLTIYIGYAFLGDRKYYFISLLIILETMLPFALVFESRKPQARELVVIAVLFGIAAAGRAAFFMLPSFKPVIAMVIISGVAFGGEAGFLVGAVTGFVSNIFFGQGPWTPWQMFAFGIIGFLAGVLFRKGLLGRGRLSLSVFGALAAVVIYGGIMNPAMLLIYQAHLNWAMFFAVYLQGLPFDLVHGIATVLFLQIGSQVMLEKLDRIKMKYGLVE